MMKIGIDLDEVLADLIGNFIIHHNQTYGTFLKKEYFKTYSFSDTLGITSEEGIKRVYDFYKTKYFKDMQPIKDATETINLLNQQHNLYLVTSRPDFLKKETEEWLVKYFQNSFLDIFYSSNHYSKRNNCGKTKSQLCEDLGISILIDDSLEYILQCSDIGVGGLLFGDYPWNQNGNLPQNVSRTRNWKEVLEKVT